MNMDIFKDLLVIELAGVLAGPAVGMFFAELGARVIKVENKKGGGDVTRSWKLPSEDPCSPLSAYYCSVNWGKEVHFMDLNDPADHARVLSWIAEADIVISNFRAASARKLGLDADQLRHSFPKLIYAHITGYGKDDERPAFDMVLQAEAGFMYMTGASDGMPVRMPVALIDILAAHQLKEGILTALFRRATTGAGAYVHVALRDAAVASLANQATNWLMAGHIPQRMGSRHPNIAPYGDVFCTKDEQLVVLAVGNDNQFVGLCRALGLAGLEADSRFADNTSRVANREALNDALAPAIARFELARLSDALQEKGVPFGPIRNMQEVFDDPAAARLVLHSPEGAPFPGKSVRTAIFEIY